MLFFAGVLDRSGGLVDLEEDDVVGVLMGDKHPATAGVDVEVAGDLAAAGGVAHMSELAGGIIKLEEGDGVVRAHGDVDPFAVGMHARFGGGILGAEGDILGQDGDGFDKSEGALVGIVSETGFGEQGLVIDQDVLAAGREHQVARARAWRRGGEAVIGKGTRGGIDLVGDDFVEPQIADQNVAVVGREIGGVGVRRDLSIEAGSLVLDEGDGFAQRTIVFDLEGSNAAGAVIGYHQDFAGGIDVQVAGAAAFGTDLVDELHGAIRIDGKGAHATIAFAHGVHVLAGGMGSQEAGIGRFDSELGCAEFARGGIEQREGDAFAIAFATGVGAEVDA